MDDIDWNRIEEAALAPYYFGHFDDESQAQLEGAGLKDAS